MTIISDSVSLILLAKTNLLEMLTEKNEVVVPKLVYQEVIKGKDKGREDSMLVDKLVSEKKILLRSANITIKNKITKMLNLRGGELEVVTLALGKNKVILTDDRKCINAARALKIDFITSLDVVIAFYKKGAISKEMALKCLDGLEEYGWYSKNLIKNYREVIK